MTHRAMTWCGMVRFHSCSCWRWSSRRRCRPFGSRHSSSKVAGLPTSFFDIRFINICCIARPRPCELVTRWQDTPPSLVVVLPLRRHLRVMALVAFRSLCFLSSRLSHWPMRKNESELRLESFGARGDRFLTPPLSSSSMSCNKRGCSSQKQTKGDALHPGVDEFPTLPPSAPASLPPPPPLLLS